MAVWAVLAMGSAAAGTLGRTQQPYWNVGEYNRALSSACQRGEFNQRRNLDVNIGYDGPIGQGITGAAGLSWNLRDPLGLAAANTSYHFFNDGYSNCRVYVAKHRLR